MKNFLVVLVLGVIYSRTSPHQCLATWYNMHGAKTASGEIMHRDSLTAAYNYAPFGTLLEVTNVSNKEVCTVKVTDRMGIKTRNRIDLSYAAFGAIANRGQGKIEVTIEVIK